MTGKMISILARERTPIKKGKRSNFRSQKVQICTSEVSKINVCYIPLTQEIK